MALRRSHTIRRFLGVVLAACVVVGCSGNDQPQTDEAQDASAQESPSAGSAESNGSIDSSLNATAVPSDAQPELSDEDLASITELAVGEQVADAQANLIAVYGIATWPESFADLSDDAQASFPFLADVDGVSDPTSQLMALDVGMCSAGIDAVGSGTAGFFVNTAATDVLSTDPVLGRELLVQHPVLQPSFAFPAAAECARGWLPILTSHDDTPAVARYVLETRPTSDAQVERHVYQWDLASSPVESADSDAPIDDASKEFEAGQTVTFNEGSLSGTTVSVDGWAEYVGHASALEGTRMVGVSLNFCPASGEVPKFGLAIDNWNIVAPLETNPLGVEDSADPAEHCFEGWLDFAVPFGGVPTAFFASDSAKSVAGYAEWSLLDAALPTPE